MSKSLRTLKRWNTGLTVVLGAVLIALCVLGITRMKANVWPKEEVWVEEENKAKVEAYVASLTLPTQNIERVVYVPGLGDCEVVVYYKDKTSKSTGIMRDGHSEIFTLYGKTEGAKTTTRILAVLLGVFVVALIGKIRIGKKMEQLTTAPV